MMSWIELDDLVDLYINAATDSRYSGIFNGVAPSPVSNFDFTKALGHAIHRPTIFPVPTLPLKLAFGEMASVILDSQSIISKRLPEVGFHFKYETVDSALNAIFHK
jgi:NAD dependent epimerase/dehydratase family enzyme